MMRILVGNKPRDPLTEKQERNISLARQAESLQSSILSTDEATRIQMAGTRRAFIVIMGATVVFSLVIASVADRADQPVTFGAAIVINIALALFLFFFLVRRRNSLFAASLGPRVSGLAAVGSKISLDATGLSIAGQVFPWLALGIDQVEFTKLSTRYLDVFLIERLLLSAPAGRVVLDPAMMQNGRVIVDNVWRRLRPGPV